MTWQLVAAIGVCGAVVAAIAWAEAWRDVRKAQAGPQQQRHRDPGDDGPDDDGDEPDDGPGPVASLDAEWARANGVPL